jgi:hypothetical protein
LYAQQQEARDDAGDDAASDAADDVVDAEFEEVDKDDQSKQA